MLSPFLFADAPQSWPGLADGAEDAPGASQPFPFALLPPPPIVPPEGAGASLAELAAIAPPPVTTAPPGAPPPMPDMAEPPLAALLARLAAPAPRPPAEPILPPDGAPPPGSGTLRFEELLRLLDRPPPEDPILVGEMPPPFMPPGPTAEDPWGSRDWTFA